MATALLGSAVGWLTKTVYSDVEMGCACLLGLAPCCTRVRVARAADDGA